eukprot:gene4588-biopygen4526
MSGALKAQGVWAGWFDEQVVYEDACMAGVVKPQGLPMHGDVSDPSFLSGLPHVLQPARVLGALPWPQHVHRLDLPTGGLVLVAKTHAVQVCNVRVV